MPGPDRQGRLLGSEQMGKRDEKLTGHDIGLLVVSGQQLQVERFGRVPLGRGDGDQDMAVLAVGEGKAHNTEHRGHAV